MITLRPFEGQAIEIAPGRYILRTNSPSSFGGNLSIPQGVQFIRFKFDMNPEVPATLQLLFNDEPFWSISNQDVVNWEKNFVTVPIPFFSEEEGALKWELSNLSETQAEAEVYDIEFGNVTPTQSPIHVPGDLNGDQLVDTADYSLFLSTFGKCTGNSAFIILADFDNDGCITFLDYQTWYGFFSAQQ